MVLGLRTKTRRSPSVQLNYIIHIQEIKPWPPSQSLRTLRAVVIQWEHADRNSGLTNQVVPSLGNGSGVGDGRIEFNESFRLPVTLVRDMSIKGGDVDIFQKNCIEFNLYEPRRDKTVKGQLLGTAVVDLADFGVIDENLTVTLPISCKRTYRNTAQPLLFLEIQPVEKNLARASSGDSLTREVLMNRNGIDSVSGLLTEEYAEEAEVASPSLTEDDVSLNSSPAVSSSAFELSGRSPNSKESGSGVMKDSTGKVKVDTVLHSEQEFAKSGEEQATESYSNGSSSRSSSIDLSSDLAWISKKISSRSSHTSPQFLLDEGKAKEQNSTIKRVNHEDQTIQGSVVNCAFDMRTESTKESILSASVDKETFSDSVHAEKKLSFWESHIDRDGDWHTSSPESACLNENDRANISESSLGKTRVQPQIHAQGKDQDSENGLFTNFPQDSKKASAKNSELAASKENGKLAPEIPCEELLVKSNIQNADRLKHGKSVRSPNDPNRGNGLVRSSQLVASDSHASTRSAMSNKRKDGKTCSEETTNLSSENKIQTLERRIKMLEGELREAAAVELGLYSVVAEHGSSTNKVHAPARRLSRLYLHAWKERSQSRRGNAAKSAVSGLKLVAKACGNDVPRLTFWLSNSIVLRAIISKCFGENQLPISAEPIIRKSDWSMNNKSLKWESFSSKAARSAVMGGLDDWENPLTFLTALEKVEGWIFSRIVESIWWQTLTPHMQSAAAKAIRRSMDSVSQKVYQRRCSSGDQQQENYSLELWKRAFRDACERICPVRAAGHECGCLPLLSRLIMEQCIARLDVAMFNAILRESAEEIPTDPVADPIGDADVLPVPPGKASFGAGAQVKNAIGNWSRWLTDLFGIDDDDSLESVNQMGYSDDDEQNSHESSLKSFHLLNALSDLMMLPKDMLLSRTIRKEVCPTFGASLIRRVLNSFIPDEFCPDPIPRVVLEALNSEDPFEDEEDSVVNFPCPAAPVLYSPPSAAKVAGILGEVSSHSQLTRCKSSVLKKSNTSDDELDELGSPLKSITGDSFRASPSSAKVSWMSKGNGSDGPMRYQLLREVWINSE